MHNYSLLLMITATIYAVYTIYAQLVILDKEAMKQCKLFHYVADDDCEINV